MSKNITKFIKTHSICPICNKPLSLIIDFGTKFTYLAVLFGIDNKVSFLPNNIKYFKYSLFEYDMNTDSFIFTNDCEYLFKNKFRIISFCPSNVGYKNGSDFCYSVFSNEYAYLKNETDLDLPTRFDIQCISIRDGDKIFVILNNLTLKTTSVSKQLSKNQSLKIIDTEYNKFFSEISDINAVIQRLNKLSLLI